MVSYLHNCRKGPGVNRKGRRAVPIAPDAQERRQLSLIPRPIGRGQLIVQPRIEEVKASYPIALAVSSFEVKPQLVMEGDAVVGAINVLYELRVLEHPLQLGPVNRLS